jgi:formylglycine-generating enzyme required for sulfatase activity
MAPMTLNDYKAQLMPIPAGSFKRRLNIGDVTIKLSTFQMGKKPVTVGMWQEYITANDLAMPALPNFPVWASGWDSVLDHPIVNVTWDDCKAYADWAGLLLPTEAQWQYAASGGDGRVYPWGDDWDSSKCHCSKEDWGDAGGTAVVGSYPAGPFDLCDMSGNVWEWCSDWHTDHYSEVNETDPTGALSGNFRVQRGGSWHNNVVDRFRCVSPIRDNPNTRSNQVGFRLSSPGPR